MTTLEPSLQQEWAAWHAEREEQLRTPHGWLSLTALHWLDDTARAFDELPGYWRATGDGGVELTADGGAAVDGTPVTGTVRLEPVDGQPGVLVEIGERRVEVIRRTDDYALRVRDPEAITRTAFTGAPAFDVDGHWVVEGRFEAYPEPRRLTVGAVVATIRGLTLQHASRGAGIDIGAAVTNFGMLTLDGVVVRASVASHCAYCAAGVLSRGAALTVAVALETLGLEGPAALLAVTATRMAWPTSVEVRV